MTAIRLCCNADKEPESGLLSSLSRAQLSESNVMALFDGGVALATMRNVFSAY